MWRRAIFTACMLAPTAAFAQGADGGPAPLRCGAELTDEGACYGEVAAFCDEPNLTADAPDAGVTTVDCAALRLDGEAVGGACVELPGGVVTCGVDEGRPCALPGEGGIVQLACLAGGALDEDAACDLDVDCTSGAPCAASAPACDGDRLQLACAPFGQALVVDCAALGGRCEEGGCVEVERGGRCGASLSCADGLACVGDERGLGTCLPEGAAVNPVDPPAADPPPPPASCSAPHGSTGAPLGWLAPFALVFLGRWRGKRAAAR